MSERRWRSAANRPSRQARRGWASLYEAPSQKKTTCRVQQKFNSPKFFLTPTRHPPTPSPHKNPSPHPPRPNPSRPRAFSGQTRANLGQNRAISGRFWVDSRLPRARIAPILAPVSPLGEPPLPREIVQKLHLPARASKRTLFLTLSQNHTKYRVFITNNSKFTPLSL